MCAEGIAGTQGLEAQTKFGKTRKGGSCSWSGVRPGFLGNRAKVTLKQDWLRGVKSQGSQNAGKGEGARKRERTPGRHRMGLALPPHRDAAIQDLEGQSSRLRGSPQGPDGRGGCL